MFDKVTKPADEVEVIRGFSQNLPTDGHISVRGATTMASFLLLFKAIRDARRK